MRIHVVEHSGRRFVETDATELFLSDEGSAVELIGSCGEYSAERLLLHAGNVPDTFFDLKSGLAGAVLQKFVNYHMKVALIAPPEMLKGKFREYVLEANRGRHFRIFERPEDAKTWLTQD